VRVAGGEICTIDELSVQSAWRGRGYATALITSLQSGKRTHPGVGPGDGSAAAVAFP